MAYFTDGNGNVMWYEPEQIAEGYAVGLTEITEIEKDILVSASKPPLTAEEVADAAKLVGATYTLNGTDYVVSFTKHDGDAVTQVKTAFDLGVTNTVIHFSNCTHMPISAVDFPTFGLWFATQRNAFFQL